MSDLNLDYCDVCLVEASAEREIVCCDGCEHAWHPQCLRGHAVPHFFGYDGCSWYCDAQCAVRLAARQRTVCNNLEDKSTARIVANMFDTGHPQLLWSPNRAIFDDFETREQLARTFGLWYSDPRDPTEHVVVASLSGKTDLKPNAWHGNMVIASVTGTPAHIFPLDSRIMRLIEQRAARFGKSRYAVWQTLYVSIKALDAKRPGATIRVDGEQVTVRDLRIVPQFEHSALVRVRLDDGYYTRCLCNQECICNVYIRQIGRYCFVTGETCNGYTEVSRVTDASDPPAWAEEVKSTLQTAINRGLVAKTTLFDGDWDDEDDAGAGGFTDDDDDEYQATSGDSSSESSSEYADDEDDEEDDEAEEIRPAVRRRTV